MSDDWLDNLPDVRDGLNRKERAILYCLHQTQRELRGRNVPTVMLYGRVLELVDISQDEFQSILTRFAGFTKQKSEPGVPDDFPDDWQLPRGGMDDPDW